MRTLRSSRGFSLAELLVGAFVGALVLGLVGTSLSRLGAVYRFVSQRTSQSQRLELFCGRLESELGRTSRAGITVSQEPLVVTLQAAELGGDGRTRWANNVTVYRYHGATVSRWQVAVEGGSVPAHLVPEQLEPPAGAACLSGVERFELHLDETLPVVRCRVRLVAPTGDGRVESSESHPTYLLTSEVGL